MSTTRRASCRCRWTAPADAETGRGLILVASLATQWGFYPTPAGKAVYFTLAFQAYLDQDDDHSVRRG